MGNHENGKGSVLTGYGLYPTEVDEALKTSAQGQAVARAVEALLETPDGHPRGLTLGILARGGQDAFVLELSRCLGKTAEEVGVAVRDRLDEALSEGFLLTGAEAVALTLRGAGVRTAFAYAGTSELALCDALARAPGVALVNGRGDKESAFMAAGAGLLRPNNGVAVLHGARGLTNAGGALADSKRNEVGTVFVIGLPSTTSARFLPPHGETGLMPSMGSFVKWWHEAGPVPEDSAERARAAAGFVGALRAAIRTARQLPYGPTMFGVPQDVAEKVWVPWSAFADDETGQPGAMVSVEGVRVAADLVSAADRPLILVDDYLLKYEGAKPALAALSSLSDAPVLQVRYRRGAMLFERLREEEVPTFAGWLDPGSPFHRELMSEADLLVTLEDRNMYRRVVGDLPGCRKLAISSDAAKVRKNEYLGEGDALIEGGPVAVLRELNQELARRGAEVTPGTWADSVSADRPGRTAELEPEVELVRTGIVEAIASAMERFDSPVLVDDSQMFGGMISEHYDQLPTRLRVFGGHGGFVGGGIAYATGLAVAEPSVRVFCTLGDQGFTNGMQGLVAAGQQQARVIYLVCNNGESVSLLKQSSTRPEWFDGGRQPYLHNPRTFGYARLAERLGVTSWAVDFRIDRGLSEIEGAIADFERRLEDALATEGPALIEMRLPSLGDFWAGIWMISGFEERRVAASAR
jgi:acetolactate synthase-1/2/3 large subunit